MVFHQIFLMLFFIHLCLFLINTTKKLLVKISLFFAQKLPKLQVTN